VTVAVKAKDVHGLLPVNKPVGMVSKDVSRWLEKRLGRLHIGHVGTLDPAASGVLPILLGRATRLQDQLLEMPKTYEFDVTFGSETDTLDLDGQVVRTGPHLHITESALAVAVRDFIGEFEQTPPLFSAVKYKGKPLYEYARANAGDEVPLAELKRRVQVSRFDLVSFASGVGRFSVTCSKGTYVRALVKDVAEKVGSCGTLTRLVRTSAAGVLLPSALDLETIEGQLDDLANLVLPVEQLDLGMPKWRCASAGEGVAGRIRAGQQVALDYAAFVTGFTEESSQAALTGWSRPLLLLDAQGRAFGVGAARRSEGGRVLVAMKRGL
jgi:tRNA pseudouridine55 synthase